MFSYLKALNKKFICSICSACLLCAMGTSQLKAAENPLRLGDNTVSVAEVGKNIFLTNSLKDNIYSSHLLPIFSEAPILYVDENGNPSLTIQRVLADGYRIVPYGKGKSVTVYIAATPYSENSSVNEIPFNNLNWYVLDQSSWKNLCVKDPGKYTFYYHVLSTDNGIKGTVEGLQSSLNINVADSMVNMISDNFFLNSESSESESNEFEELNSNTQKLGFRYSYVDEDESTTKNNTFQISNNIHDFFDFLVKLLNGNYTLLGEVRQYNKNGNRMNDLTIEPTPYAYCMMTHKLAEQLNDENMIRTIELIMTNLGISAQQPFGKTMLQSNGDALPVMDIDKIYTLKFETNEKILLTNKSYSVINKKQFDTNEISQLVKDQVKNPNLNGKVRVHSNAVDLIPITFDIQPNLFSCLNFLTLISIKMNDTNAIEAISSLMSQYHITQENPNGLKLSSLL